MSFHGYTPFMPEFFETASSENRRFQGGHGISHDRGIWCESYGRQYPEIRRCRSRGRLLETEGSHAICTATDPVGDLLPRLCAGGYRRRQGGGSATAAARRALHVRGCRDNLLR